MNQTLRSPAAKMRCLPNLTVSPTARVTTNAAITITPHTLLPAVNPKPVSSAPATPTVAMLHRPDRRHGRGRAFLQLMYGHVAAGSNYPITTSGGEWKSFVMEIVLTLILVTVILNTATGYRSIGHNAALAVGATVALLGLFASPISGASMNPPARSVPTSSPTT